MSSMMENINLIKNLKETNYVPSYDNDRIENLYREILDLATDKFNFMNNSQAMLNNLRNETLTNEGKLLWLKYANNVLAAYYVMQIYNRKMPIKVEDFNIVLEYVLSDELTLEIKSLGVYSLAQLLETYNPELRASLMDAAFEMNPRLETMVMCKIDNWLKKSLTNNKNPIIS